MRSDCTRNMNAEGGDFRLRGRLRVGPNSSQTCNAFCRNTEVCAGADQDFFESANIFNGADRLTFLVGGRHAAQVENRISDNLAGPVEGHIAPTVAFENLDTSLGEFLR